MPSRTMPQAQVMSGSSTASQSIPCSSSSSSSPMPMPMIIQPPAPLDSSYSWEDFPVVEHEYYNTFAAPTLSSSLPSMELLSSDSSMESSSEESSLFLLSDDEEESSMALVEEQQEQPAAMGTSSSSSTTSTTRHTRRGVRFAPTVNVRTYSITLGDHPLCEALPLALDWDYEHTTLSLDVMEETHEAMEYYYRNRKQARRPSRLSYLERKQRLLEVGGYTAETLQAFEQQQQTAVASSTAFSFFMPRSDSTPSLSVIHAADV